MVFPLRLRTGVHAVVIDEYTLFLGPGANGSLLLNIEDRARVERIINECCRSDEFSNEFVGELLTHGIVEPTNSIKTGSAQNAPSTLYVELTRSCNLACSYCYVNAADVKSRGVAAEPIYYDFRNYMDNGIGTVVFTGGEPFLRHDIYDLAREAQGAGLRTAVITNGQILSNEAAAHQAAQIFKRITISIDGGCATVNDRTRGKGSFKKAMLALDNLEKEETTKVVVNTVVHDDNIDSLPDLFEILSRKQVPVKLTFLCEMGRGKTNGSMSWATLAKCYDLIWEWRLKVQFIGLSQFGANAILDIPRHGCGMSTGEIFLDSQGVYYPCRVVNQDEFNFGNSSENYRDVLAGNRKRDFDNRYVNVPGINKSCELCPISNRCGGGCRGNHFQETGSISKNGHYQCRLLKQMIISGLLVEEAERKGIALPPNFANVNFSTMIRKVS